MNSQSDMYNKFLERLNATNINIKPEENLLMIGSKIGINNTIKYEPKKWLDANHFLNSLKKI